MKIGVACTTTPNREHVYKQWFSQYAKMSPEVFLYVHNDVDYRGIAYSKNKCLATLYAMGCTDLFLFDDDCMPTVEKWYEPYVNSGLNHACWNLNREKIYTSYLGSNKPTHIAYEKPNGCMLYVKREVLDVVGGWDVHFRGYGYDHVNWSDRIFNAGFTPARYIDIQNSSSLFKMIDCQSSVSEEIRMRTIPINEKLYKERFNSKEFKPFK